VNNDFLNTMRDYFVLCKPRVVLLMLLTVWAGMTLASTGSLPWSLWVNATLGIALLSGAAATMNHIIDHRIDAIMERTKHRPLASGKLSLSQAWVFATMQSLLGFFILYLWVNPLTALLTALTAVGYAIIYSIFLKRSTPQNIVIGGLSGAMPPLLGWVAVTGQLDAKSWLLVLIIFAWTPAHFWALCIHRLDEYKKSSYPMLPVTHGVPYTKLNILFYTILTAVTSVLPYITGMSGHFYLVSVLLLNAGFLFYAVKLQFAPENNTLALRTFHYSLIYLTGLFAALLIDHHLMLS
jgi:protoheme IX farnesyltransferase